MFAAGAHLSPSWIDGDNPAEDTQMTKCLGIAVSPGNDVMYAREPLGAHAIAIAMEAAGGGCSLKDTRCPEAIIVTAVMAVAGMVSGVTK